jgi:hypothetical protein
VIAALYVDPRGPYFGRPDVDPWDETRDARLYDGPHPVVSHPPCGAWANLRHLSRGAGKDCGPIAVDQVRKWGGVLEQPAGSTLWQHCWLPSVGAFLRDDWGGYAVEVEQVSWGHVARKRTWLYCVGVDPLLTLRTMRHGGEPTHWVSGGHHANKPRKGKGGVAPAHIKICSAQQRRRTPPLFADWLISLAESVERRTV